MEFNGHGGMSRMKAYFKVWQPEKELVDHGIIPPSYPFRIHIDFVCQTIHRWLCHDGSRTRFQREDEDPTRLLSWCVDPHMFTSYEDSLEYVAGKLSKLLIDPRYHDRIADEVIVCGRRARGLRKILPLRVQIAIVHVHVQDERELIERAKRRQLRVEIESRKYGMLPASESPIRAEEEEEEENGEGNGKLGRMFRRASVWFQTNIDGLLACVSSGLNQLLIG